MSAHPRTDVRPAPQRIHRLPQFDRIREALAAGMTTGAVADMIQGAGHCLDISKDSLSRILRRFRASLSDAERTAVGAARRLREADEAANDRSDATSTDGNAMSDCDDSQPLDVLTELVSLLRLQQERLAIDGHTEVQVGKLLPTMTQEMRLVSELVNAIARYKVDRGMHGPRPTIVTLDFHDRYDRTQVGEILKDPGKRRRLRSIADNALGLVKKRES